MAGNKGRGLASLLAMCVLVLGSVLSSIESGSRPSPEVSSYEVIIPRRLPLWTSKGKDYETSYIIKVAGTDYIVRLKHKDLLVNNLPVFTYDSNGRRIMSHHNIPSNCYWEGYVEGVLNSRVTLSTCSGLRGLLKMGGTNYGIEPLQGSSSFQHFLYRIKEMDSNASTCGMGAEEARDHMEDLGLRPEMNQRSYHPGIPMYIELFVVVDNTMFRGEDSNETKVLETVLDIINLVNSYFVYLHLHVTPCGLEIWSNNNPFGISDNITQALENFNAWRFSTLEPLVKYDTAHLFVYKNFGKEPGRVYSNAICNRGFTAAVNSHPTHNNYLLSKVLAHVLGHSIGLEHDGPECVCDKEQSCIMHLFHSEGVLFSNCSLDDYGEIVRKNKLTCLMNVPVVNKVITAKRCGDGVVDKGEECDCGGTPECMQDPCCNTDCTFKEGVVCNTGPCCYECQFYSIGKLCRAKADECDLPEYCDGESEWCPDDVYMQDGTPCNKTAYCYKRKCLTHTSVCTEIYGKSAIGAPKSCFQQLNIVGNLFGNCGSAGRRGNFLKCKEKDSMCGRAQCVGVTEIPRKWNYAQFQTTKVQDMECWSLGFPFDTGDSDVGVIPNGTHCGAEKICLGRQCVALSSLNLTVRCDREKTCNSRGICNNLHNCHCDMGWKPPTCKYFGPGGSVDGGFPLQSWNSEQMKLILGIVIPVSLLGISVLTGLITKLVFWIRQMR